MAPLIVIAMAKDEADIARSFIENLLAQGVDHLIVMDNLSTDGTTDILREYEQAGVLSYIHDPVFGYFQSRKMTRLAHMAGAMGAGFILPADFDELWYGTQGTIAEMLAGSVEDVQWVEGFYHVPHPDDDQSEPDPFKRMVHRRSGRDCPQSKVAFRYDSSVLIHPGNHNVDHPDSGSDHADPRRGQGRLAFREFQYRSYEHFVRKLRNGKAVYDATDQSLDLGIHWRRLGALSDDELAAEWERYLATPTEYDPAPYRVREAA